MSHVAADRDSRQPKLVISQSINDGICQFQNSEKPQDCRIYFDTAEEIPLISTTFEVFGTCRAHYRCQGMSILFILPHPKNSTKATTIFSFATAPLHARYSFDQDIKIDNISVKLWFMIANNAV